MLKILDNSILEFILKKSPICIYGEKGVGKTIFLLQLGYSLQVQGYKVYILGSNNTMTTINNKFFKLRNIGILNNIKTFNIFSLKDRIKALIETINELKKIENLNKTKICILIDDILPLNYQINPRPPLEETVKVNKIIFWLAFLNKILKNACIITTTGENIKKALPFKASIFHYHNFHLLRIQRISRARIFQNITIKDITNNTIQADSLWTGIILPNGFALEEYIQNKGMESNILPTTPDKNNEEESLPRTNDFA